ncbi:hypothetical protein MMC31_005687, partial [Peltigera leucophlebia]|nr:hypothetical protein [Peltigera leucophlebia]
MALDQSIIKSLSSYICYLDATVAFERLTKREKLYTHFMARIIMRPVLPESQPIFEFILETYRACDGNWESLAERVHISNEAKEGFLEYASIFLGNIGNYDGRGDQKFVPAILPEELEKISDISEKAKQLYHEIDHAIFSKPPYNLGFPSNVAQSMYYPSDQLINHHEIDQVSKILADKSIHPENKRLRKQSSDGKTVFEVLQGSAE